MLHSSYKSGKTGALYISVLCKLKASSNSSMLINTPKVAKPSKFSLVYNNLLANYGYKKMPYKLFSALIGGSRRIIIEM